MPIVIEYSIGSAFTGSSLHFGWQPPDAALLAEAVAAASAADVALVFVNDVTSEGMDRRVRMALDSASFATWSTADGGWVVYPGEYVLRVGTSSRALPEQAVVVLP